jgi:hypothetical protein
LSWMNTKEKEIGNKIQDETTGAVRKAVKTNK